jgi:molecular chaperone DnaK
LKDYGDKLSQDKREAIQKALSELKDAHKNKNITSIETGLAALNAAWQAASEEMYKATQGAQQSSTTDTNPTGGEQTGAEGNVTDVDFEEVKDEKK